MTDWDAQSIITLILGVAATIGLAGLLFWTISNSDR